MDLQLCRIWEGLSNRGRTQFGLLKQQELSADNYECQTCLLMSCLPVPCSRLRLCFQEPLTASDSLSLCAISCVPTTLGVFISSFLPFPCHSAQLLHADVDRPDLRTMGLRLPNRLYCGISLHFSLCPCRRFFQTAHFYVEESSSPRVVANENIPVIPIPGKLHFLHCIRIFMYVMFKYPRFYVKVCCCRFIDDSQPRLLLTVS